MLRLAFAAAGLWLVLGPGPASASGAPDFAARLPAKVGEWKKPAAPQKWDRKTLYDYIDGGAELYLAYDFVSATSFEYTAGKDDLIKVDVFDMGSPRGAFGAFAHGRESVSAEVGQGSEYAGGLLTFWKHRYYVSVLGYPETEAKRKAVYELGNAIAGLIPENGALPEILKALPKAGLVEASARTFHHHLLQNDYVSVSSANPLGINPKTEAVQARYERKGERHVLMVVDYPAEDEAKQGQKGFTESVLGGAAVSKKGERWAGVKRKAKRLVIVLDAPTKAAVEQALSEVP
ncbi:MAG: hypothetical protein QM765_43245 [Myxococcales bacterium]